MRLVSSLIFFYLTSSCGNPEGFQLRSEIIQENEDEAALTEEVDEPIMVGGAFLQCIQSLEAETSLVSVSCSANFEDPQYIPSQLDLYIEIEGIKYYPQLNGNKWEWSFSQEEVENADLIIKSDLPSQKGKSQKTGKKKDDKNKGKKSKSKNKKGD